MVLPFCMADTDHPVNSAGKSAPFGHCDDMACDMPYLGRDRKEAAMTTIRNFMEGFAFIALVPVFAGIVMLALWAAGLAENTV